MLLMPVGPQLMRLFNISPQKFSFLVAAYTLSAGVSGFLASFIVDFFDRKRVLLVFFFGFCLGTLACGLATSYESLLFARALAGFFGGVLNSLVMAIVSDSIVYEKRGSAMGIVSTAFSLASVFGVPLGIWIATQFDWHISFKLLAGLAFLLLFLMVKWVPSQKEFIRDRAAAHLLQPLIRVATTPTLLRGLLFAGALVLGQFLVIPFLSPSLVSNAGMQESQLPWVYAFGGALTFFSGPWVGRMADRFGKRLVFKYGLLASLVPIFLITHLPTLPVAMVLAVTTLFFVCVNARWIPAMAMISAVTAPQYRGSFMSYVGCIQQLMAGVGSLVAGMIVYRDDFGHLVDYEIVGYVAVTISLLALYLSKKIVILET